MTQELRAYPAESTQVDSQARTVVATINTDAIDRYRTVVDPAGAMLENYRKNPVVLLNHGSGESMGDGCTSLPIGRNLWIKAQKGKLIAKTQFLPEGVDEYADKVFRMYELGYLNAWSVRFNPMEASPPTPAEIKKRPDLATCLVMYRKWDLVEYSCVTVPGNPDAVGDARSAGLSLPWWPAEPANVRAEIPTPTATPTPQITLPPLVGRTFGQVQQAVFAELTRQLGEPKQVAADLIDLARGRV
jgi:hypothetical protein